MPNLNTRLVEAIIRSATDYAIVSFDGLNKVTSWSPGAEVLLGWTANEMLGKDAAVVFTPEDREQRVPEFERQTAIDTGRAENERWHIRKDGSRFWGSGVLVPLKEGAPPGFVKIMQDRTKQREGALALRQSEQRFRALVESIPQLVWRSNSLGDRTWGSPQWEIFTGLSLQNSVGHGWLDAIHPDDRELTLETWHEAERTGGLYVEHRTRRAADGEYRWFQTRGTRLTEEGCWDREWFGTSTDIHDLKRSLERYQVLVRELHHRTRNLLGVVNALARQTLARSKNLEEFEQRFSERIAALGRVQSLVSHADFGVLGLRELVETEVNAHAAEGDDRIEIVGPPVTLNEKAAETLALALHELATNAVKYGALAKTQGKLEVRWAVRNGRAVLEWIESGIEVGQLKHGRGYGRELIEVALPFALGAQTRFDLKANGLYCCIELPEHEWSAP